jgi:hypothetical protein
MVTIPTEKRKYYDEVSKTNTLGTYAGALLPAAQQYQEVVKQQQEIKIDSSMTDARLQMDKITNDWREANKDNPNNPEAMKELQANYNQVFSVLRNDIDPLYRQNFDLEANKLKGGYDINNQAWALKQNQENVKYHIRNSINNYLELARNYGSADNGDMATVDFEQSYDKLLDYAAKNLGTEQAAYLLNNYEEKFAKAYINGLSESNPQKAIEVLQNDKKIQKMLGGDALKEAHKIVDKQIKLMKYQQDVSNFENAYKLDEQLSGMSDFDALQTLEANKDNVSEKWYKAKKAGLMNNLGINEETQADTYLDLLTQINSINSNMKEVKASEFIKQANDVIDNIESEYSKGKLKLADKKRLMSNLNKRQGKALPKLIKEKSSWYSFYDYSDAQEDFNNSLVNSGKTSQAMLEYDRTLAEYEQEGREINTETKKNLVRTIVRDYTNKQLNESIKNLDTIEATLNIKWKDGYRSFETQEDLDKAFELKRVKKGDKIYFKGVLGEI